MSNNIMLLAEMRSLLEKECRTTPDVSTIEKGVAVLRATGLEPGPALDVVAKLDARVAEEGGKLERSLVQEGEKFTLRAVFDVRPR